MTKTAKTKTIKIRQVRSSIGTPQSHRQTLQGLGLRRIQQVVERQDTPAVRGMVAKVPYLVEVLEESR